MSGLKGRLSDTGGLEITRRGKRKQQSCPFEDSTYCGDHCPHFSEPVINSQYTTIKICLSKTLHFSDFEDRRDVG